MKYFKLGFCLFLLILFFIPFESYTQNNESADSLNINIKNAAKKIMTSAGMCALITLDKEGRPRVREMDPFLPEEDFTVWFGTNPASRKVSQIENDQRVTLYYLDKDGSGYVMIHGEAQLINDREEKEKRWKTDWEAFYPNKTDSYLLIKVIPEWMEVISYAYGILGDPDTWEPPVVHFNSK